MVDSINDTIVELRPSEVMIALATALEDHEPLMFVGPPGCGKSEMVAQACRVAKHDLLITHPVTSDPTDAKGLPWIAEGAEYAEFKPFGIFYKALTAKKPTVVFIDDLGQAPDAVQASFMQPVLNREIDGRRFPDHVTFIAATNRRTDKAGVKAVLEPVKGRFTILHVTVDVDDFCDNLFERGTTEYGLTEDAVVSGAAYMHFVPKALSDFVASGDITNTPTPRNWVTAFRFAQKGLPEHIEHALVAGRVGAGYAAQYSGYMKSYRNKPNLDAILTDPQHAPIPDDMGTLWAIAVGLANKAEAKNFDRVATYATRLEEAGRGEFASLMVRDSVRHDPRITNTKAYIQLTSGTVGRLMTGRV